MNELQVIILAAGKGSRLREITSSKPKCLLPIGIYPMVYYPIKMFEKAGFKEVFVVVSETAKSEVEVALEQTDLDIKYNLVIVPSEAEDKGTAYSLRYMASYITSDFIVVSGDLLSTVDIKSVLDFHRTNDGSITALYFRTSKVDPNIVVPGSKSGNKTEKDLVGIDPVTSRLIFSASASDYVKNLRIGRGLLYKHGRMRMHTTLLDAHFYIMKKWLIKYLTHDEKLTTVKGELLPYAVRTQLSSKNKLSQAENTSEVTPVKDELEEKSIDIFSLAKDFGYNSTAQCMSAFIDHSGDLCPVYMNDKIRCYAYIAEGEFGLRCNSIREFIRANKLITEKWKEFANVESKNISEYAFIASNQLEEKSCFVGPKTNIEAKTSISTSTLGSGVKVQEKTIVTGCIIMNNVSIGVGCTVHNCIICDDVIIQPNSNLKDCFIGSRYTVPANSSHKNEMLAEVENFMEVS